MAVFMDGTFSHLKYLFAKFAGLLCCCGGVIGLLNRNLGMDRHIIKIMRSKKDLSVYEAPQMKLVEIQVEAAILTVSGSNVENLLEGEESDW